jgi:hypothetical protein
MKKIQDYLGLKVFKILLIDMQLYPVPSFYQTFQKPYLTPDKHQAYYWFWGSCSILGIFSIL